MSEILRAFEATYEFNECQVSSPDFVNWKDVKWMNVVAGAAIWWFWEFAGFIKCGNSANK